MHVRVAWGVYLVFLTSISSLGITAPSKTSNEWTNDSKTTIVSIRIGNKRLSSLDPGNRITGVQADAPVVGRFKVDEWLDVDITKTRWLPFHLRTSGHLLDALDPGKPGDPRSSANLLALKTLPVSYLDDWEHLPPDWKCLLARASRHASPTFIATLISLTEPNPSTVDSCRLVNEVGDVSTNIRAAIE